MSADATKRLGKLDYLETLPGDGPRGAQTAEQPPLAFGGRIGRHLILDTLGQGGMGIVYAAYDPVLDRRIAVKLLIRDEGGTDASAGRARMQREAQALARLSHPNVITVHDVGETDGSMYIAMELVDGTTLREHQKQKPWRVVLEAYLAAARGLAAAHAAGLVHRDFKPENVLVGKDGRVRVTDFGLARRAGEVPKEAAAKTASPSAFDSDLTAAGTVMGTLAYMAPEQIDGAPVDARSDQTSWCIAAWEAIYGDQPFVVAMPAIRSAAMQTDTPKPPAKTAVPRAVGKILARGLLPKADQRWPDMATLVAELERAMSNRRFVAGATAAAGLATIAAVFAVGRLAGRDDAASAATPFDCSIAGAPAASLWTARSRADLEQAFAATGAPFAHDAAAGVEKNVLAWRARWQQIAVESCQATHVTGSQTAATGDLRTACLVRDRDTVAQLLAAFAHADRARVEAAPMQALPELEACSDPLALAGVPPPPTDAAARTAIEGALDKLEAELEAGLPLARAQELRGVAKDQVAAAQKLAWAPLTARARRALAEVERELGHGKEARSALVGAAADASAAGEQDELVDIYANLSDLEARVTSDFSLGEDWLALGTGTLAKLGPRPRKTRKLATARGVLLERAGDFEAARAAFQIALPIAETLDDPPLLLKTILDLARVETSMNQVAPAHEHLARAQQLAHATVGDKHPLAAAILHDLGTVAFREGKYAEALAQFHQALAIREAAFGPDSVEYGRTLQAIGNAEIVLDRFEDARAHFTTAIGILTARLGAEHPDVADALNDIGGTYHRAGRYADALAQNLKVLAIREKVLGKDHIDTAESLVNAAIEAKNLGKWDLVDAMYARAIPIYEAKSGKDSVDIAVVMINYGEARRAQGRWKEALEAYERTRAIFTKQLGADHPMLAHVWNGEGQLALAQGHAAEAVPLLEKAVAMRQAAGTDATDLAESRFALARALPAGEAARATELAKQALPVYRDAGPGYAKRADEVAAWLKTR